MKWEPMDVNGAVFRPLGRIMYVEEPEFGCEGRPDDAPVYGTVVLQERGKDGTRSIRIEEHLLFSGHIDDGMWYGMLAGQLILLGRDKQTVIHPNDAEAEWLNAL